MILLEEKLPTAYKDCHVFYNNSFVLTFPRYEGLRRAADCIVLNKEYVTDTDILLQLSSSDLWNSQLFRLFADILVRYRTSLYVD